MILKSLMMKNGQYFHRFSSIYFALRKSIPTVASQRSQNVSTSCCSCAQNVALTAVPQESDNLEKDPSKETQKKEKKKKTLNKSSISDQAESKSKAKSMSTTAKLILEHVNRHCGTRYQHQTHLLPKQSLKTTTVIPTSLYLIDEKEAKNISKAIESENPDKDSPIVELNPGLGLLTWELVNKIGFKHVTCLEDCSTLGENLASLFNVSVIDCSVDDLPRHHHLDKHDGGERINSILTSITTGTDFGSSKSVTSKKPLYIIGAVPHVSIMNFLIRCYVTKRVFFEDDLPWSGVTMYVAFGAKAAHICTAKPETGFVAYRPTSVFFQTLFTSKEIGTIPSKAFLPWQMEDLEFLSGKKTRRLKVKEPSILRLMKIEVNLKVQEKIGKDNLFIYWYFVRQHLYARRNRIIPELERWVPGCGVALIKQGFNIYSQFGMLQPNEILELYFNFVSLPEFANSSFLNAVEKFQTRLELTEDEDDNK